jgi:hypothetical protein
VFTSKPLRYWTTSNGKNMRVFLVSVAKKYGLDALVPSTWYDFPRKIIEEMKVVCAYFLCNKLRCARVEGLYCKILVVM